MESEPLWYVMHSHGDGGRHAHSTEMGHEGSITNPRANDHEGVETMPWEQALKSWKLKHEISRQDSE